MTDDEFYATIKAAFGSQAESEAKADLHLAMECLPEDCKTDANLYLRNFRKAWVRAKKQELRKKQDSENYP